MYRAANIKVTESTRAKVSSLQQKVAASEHRAVRGGKEEQDYLEASTSFDLHERASLRKWRRVVICRRDVLISH